LVDRFSPTSVPSFVQGKAPPYGSRLPTPSTDNNASRTTVRQSVTPYAEAGTTQDSTSVYAGAALVKTHLPGDNDLELMSGSGQVGIESEVQASAARGTLTSGMFLFDAAVSADLLTLRLNLGIQNDDGSVGANIGGTAELVGVEVTASRSGWSATFGLSASAGAAASVGFRDADGDGREELCGKISIPAVTVGLCAERFW
jgi:hypothetical protein